MFEIQITNKRIDYCFYYDTQSTLGRDVLFGIGKK
uniref:Uncharacterized protein n=1 Tax=Anguilla anguilla TaxID=7936 RepID=A0A0E9R1H6_ANGAN